MLAAGEVEEARSACDELETVAGRYSSAMLDAVSAYERAAVELAGGDARRALELLRRALDAWRTLEAPYEVARTRVLIGEACRLLDDTDACALELEAALADFVRLGALPDAGRVEQLLGRKVDGTHMGSLGASRRVAPGGVRQEQSRDRGGARDQRAHGRPARPEHLREAPRLLPDGGNGVRLRARARLTHWSELTMPGRPQVGGFGRCGRGFRVLPSTPVEVNRGGGRWKQRNTLRSLVVGAGQAGLALGYHLQRRGRQVLLVDRNERIGDSWRARWDSLKLYSPASYDGLPGMPFPAGRTAYPTKDEMADYLEAYAARFELPVRLGTGVESLTEEDGGFVAHTGGSRIEADTVVVGTGVFAKPYVPELAGELSPSIAQLHSSAYRNPVATPGRPGAGGRRQPLGLGHRPRGGRAARGRAFGSRHRTASGFYREQARPHGLPRPLLRRYARPHGRHADGPEDRPHIRHGGAPLLRYRRSNLRKAGVERVLGGRPASRTGCRCSTVDACSTSQNVVWCTGFRPDYSWIQLPLAIGEDGFPLQYRGASTPPGLYFVGLPFLHSFASMLIGGASRDAERVATHIATKRLEGQPLVWNGRVTKVRELA